MALCTGNGSFSLLRSMTSQTCLMNGVETAIFLVKMTFRISTRSSRLVHVVACHTFSYPVFLVYVMVKCYLAINRVTSGFFYLYLPLR